MDASTQRGVVDGRVRLETEDSFVLYPDRVTCHIPFPQRQLRALRGETHPRFAYAQRILRASFVFDGGRQQYEWSRGHQDEQLQGERVFLGALRQERTAPKHRS